MLLWVLAIAVERQLPLTTALTAFRRDVSAAWRRRMDRLTAFLEGGVSLPDALDQVPDLLPEECVLSIRVGLENGTLAKVLREEARYQNELHSRVDNTFFGVTLYIAALFLMTTAAFTFSAYYLIPKFKHLFTNFGMALPEATQTLFELSDAVERNLFLVIPVVLLCSWWLAVYALAFDTRMARRVSLYPTGHVPPFLGRLVTRQATVQILRRLSYVIEAGRPEAGAILTMAKYHSHSPVSLALASVYVDYEHGVSCWESLAQVGMLSSREARLLTSSEQAGNLPWALKRTADRISDAVDYKCRKVIEYVGPILLLIAGTLIGAYIIAFFMPLVTLISMFS